MLSGKKSKQLQPHEEAEPIPKELFHPDDETQNYNTHTSAYDTLIERCGSGDPINLRKCSIISRLLSNCNVYKDILDYVHNSSEGTAVTVKEIYKIQRFDDMTNRVQGSHRMMLWHGTSPDSIPGIIETGFRMGRRGLFGGGIYFADRIAKSLMYTGNSKETGVAFLVLAEVVPGQVYKAHHFHIEYKKPPRGYDSVKGNGQRIPTWADNRDYFGAIMPSGITRNNQRHDNYDMKYNEYIIYDMDRVVVKYIVVCTL